MTPTESTADPEAGLAAADHMLGDALATVTLIEYPSHTTIVSHRSRT